MAIYDTTDVLSTTMQHKSQLSKNFAANNYWIEGYQNKINQAWRFATDVVDVVEQTIDFNQDGYLYATPNYHPLEVRITTAYDEKGQRLSDDFRNIIYHDVQHPMRLGCKYYFDQHDFAHPNNASASTWLTINLDSVAIGANAIIRRCTHNLGFLIKGSKFEHYEPAIIDYDPKYTINYFQQVLNVVKSEAYATLQFNEYTKDIAVNDRFIIGALNFTDINKNSVYKVKEVFRFGSLTTDNPNNVPLMMLALERDVINPEYDYIAQDNDGTLHYIADYYNMKQDSGVMPDLPIQTNEYVLEATPTIDLIRAGQEATFTFTLKHNGDIIPAALNITTALSGPQKPYLYYESVVNGNDITIKCLKAYYRSPLIVSVTADAQYDIEPLLLNITLAERL